MASNNDEDVDLGLSLGPRSRVAETSNNGGEDVGFLGVTNCIVETTGLDESPGAGVNAADVAAFDEPLCELVWSARSGLSLNKCADSNPRPLLLWNVWPELPKSGHDKVVDEEERLIVAPEVLDGISELGEKGTLFRSSRGSSSCEKGLCGSHSVRVRGKHAADDGEVTSTCGKVIKNQPVAPIPITGPVLDSGAEKSLADVRVCLHREKGKQKVLSCERSSNDHRHGSKESAESCNSTRLSSRGVKRRLNDEGGSERRKMQIQESRVFPRLVGPCFVNWISTLVKGRHSDRRDETPHENVTPVKKLDKKSSKSRFYTLFQSLYIPTAKKSESKWNKEATSPHTSRKIVGPLEKTSGNERSDQAITRIYTREDLITENRAPEIVVRPNANPDDISKPQDDSAAQETQRFAVPSLFAKILDALKHITLRLENTDSLMCYFCGKSGHNLRKCPELTEAELHGLLANIGSFERVGEDPHCLCLKCFQFGHWAISCPSGNADMACGSKNLSTSNEFQEWDAGNLFRAVRKLRLSRSDILRCMKSDVSLDGFFIRLRLRKSEAGLEGTGYYAARISEDAVENVSGKSKKFIWVDVGGIKSCVGSQYISNHDFLEDEVKAWCGGMVKAGGMIPSLDELNAKVEYRTCLGFK